MQAPLSLALDLGSTRVKLASLNADGSLGALRTRPAPRPSGSGLVRELDAQSYAEVVDGLLAELTPAERELPLGVASQRSSFLLWERTNQRPVTPLISWQDRRAHDWCEAHAGQRERVRALTGLPLSPHYAGPKLAVLLAERPELRSGLREGSLAFGTLETWWLATQASALHETDLSMAARTLLVDVRAGAWSDELLEWFGLPAEGLPRIVDSHARSTPLAAGPTLVASVADQGSGLYAALGDDPHSALVNLGTGGFVLRPTGTEFTPREGYLVGPVLSAGPRTLHALEGTINAGGATVDRIAPRPTHVPPEDPAPECFCLPDENGLGAPHWRADFSTRFSAACSRLSPEGRRRIALEGLAFRVREILDDLGRAGPLERVVLSGGLTHSPFVRASLAALLPCEVRALREEEATLLGVARLAAGGASSAAPRTESIEALQPLSWLESKYAHWRSWVRTQLDT